MSLETSLNNLNLYDAKKYFRKAQNIVFNYTEIESKVREATNNEPWGASSTLMEQISRGTYNYKEREEIIGMIFRRFTEKSANEWRQIYKALQLLEYLIKHGSERFIDDCRANLSLISMLKDFHYIDNQGKDQGINVRTRALSIVEFLKDDNQIREERKKARETAQKYKGVSNMIGTNGNSAAIGPQFNNRPYTAPGFIRPSTNSISVSADFDDLNDTNGTRDYNHYKSTSYEEYKEDLKEEQNNTNENTKRKSIDFTYSNNNDLPDLLDTSIVTEQHHDEERKTTREDEDDDEFADFQSSIPVAKEPAPVSTADALKSLYNTTTINNAISDVNARNNSNNFSYSTLNPNNNNTNNRNNSNLVSNVALNNKPSDPFSALFNTAKTLNQDTLNPTQPAKKEEITKKEDKEEEKEYDDDDFGELTGPNNIPTGHTNTEVKEPQLSNTNNIDLLDL
ncbi:related to Epsin-3 [Saccharomycodes ludwigii]|uniref:Related to Epsin-3 n=1 Tax=Saccharomycodes ludwigii TaxID=36035 RepID=A0A376B274_9ASCO|nr:hypothetical protein SCDLUD_004346 [Saccharomycodes ludwigii]KAH3900029.1 hypothetical protein SCDLUD_004346 [Saccharomycodes ludwigii]SSD58796.1 related to Epsin-3 [Saccharomycodes ludwigii]